MKSFLLYWPVAAGLLLTAAGCTHIDVTPAGDPNRELGGTVSAPAALPAGAELLVRLVDVSPAGPPAMGNPGDLPLGDRGRAIPAERVLGEYRHTLGSMTTEPVAFKLEYRAEDSVLRHGLNLDVRISFGGRVRYRTIQAHVVTLASSPFPQVVVVQPLP